MSPEITLSEKERTYTVSAWLKSEKPTTVRLGFFQVTHRPPKVSNLWYGNGRDFKVGPEWKRYSATFKIPKEHQYGFVTVSWSNGSVSVDGIQFETGKGSEYALPAAELSKTAIIPAVKSGISTKLELYSEEDAKASVHWVSSSGMTDVKTVILEGGKVKIEDLGTVPDNAEAICITSTEKMTAQAIQEKNDERNDDFALIPAVNAGKTWSAAIPDETSAFMKIVNARANSKISVKINGYNSNGEQTGEKTVFLEGGFAFGFRPEDIGRDCVAFIAEAENASDKTAQNSGSSKAQQSEPKITLSAILEPESSDFSGISFLSGSSANSSLTELHAKRSLTVFN